MRIRLLAGVLTLALAMTACSGGSSDDAAGAGAGGGTKTVRLAINPWIGYEASAAVVAYLLEHELGYKVEKIESAEADSWKGFEKGTVDAVLENWSHPELKKEYIEDKKVAITAGEDGNKGVIGWYVPEWMVQKYPDITDWHNLVKYKDLFKTDKSEGLGQFLAGDKSFVTNDEALIKNLNLPYKVVYAGSEDALIAAARKATENETPLLMYFYEPQWLFNQLKLVKINLPPYAIGCDDNVKTIKCDYPPYLLDKIVSVKFAKTGGKAYEFIKNWTWTNDDQNAVAYDMSVNKMSAEAAAKKWVDANKIVWQDWIPA
ncbi:MULTISPECIES: ABC transporter substrate-binding protein [Microbispora]|uniref:Glycine/betaine ABC transporter substrate-binding protein n=1 Tax=Microbispora catharanthi TaxID=1712871 RepID=A0A5N6BSS2_9ACTN|nr:MULTISPECIES: ABC transporter substrate-binding protein [Microbispora]KAB8183515.1 glycine/betaine ABC transporter substrate-binding protein [Microbispora catharanthi]